MLHKSTGQFRSRFIAIISIGMIRNLASLVLQGPIAQFKLQGQIIANIAILP